MALCCVPFCKMTSKRARYIGISIHEFPANVDKIQKWLEAIGRENFRPNLEYRKEGVCSLHFQDSDYSLACKIRRLTPDAVPSVFLFKTDPFLSAQQNTGQSAKLFKNVYFRKLSSPSPAKYYFQSSSPFIATGEVTTDNSSPATSENLIETFELSTSKKIENMYVNENHTSESEKRDFFRTLSLATPENLHLYTSKEVESNCFNELHPSLHTTENENNVALVTTNSLEKPSASEKLSTSSQNSLDINKELSGFKLQNIALKAKIFRKEEKISKLQSRLNAAIKELRVQKSKEYLALQNIMKASAENNRSATKMMSKFLLFSKQLKRKLKLKNINKFVKPSIANR